MIACESHASLIQQEADEFRRLYPDAAVSVTAASTREAFVQLLNDSVRIIVCDRALNDEERSVAQQAGLNIREYKIAEDALAVIVNRQNLIEQIDMATLKKICSDEISSWDELEGKLWSGGIELCLTGKNSGVYELLSRQFFNLQKDLPLSYAATTQKDALEYVATHPRAITFVSALSLDHAGDDSTEGLDNSNLRLLAVAASDSANSEFVKLHQANIYRKLYPLRYSVYIYTSADRASLANGFSAFVASAPGQKLVLNAGLVPATMPVRLVQLN